MSLEIRTNYQPGNFRIQNRGRLAFIINLIIAFIINLIMNIAPKSRPLKKMLGSITFKRLPPGAWYRKFDDLWSFDFAKQNETNIFQRLKVATQRYLHSISSILLRTWCTFVDWKVATFREWVSPCLILRLLNKWKRAEGSKSATRKIYTVIKYIA